MRRPLSLLAAGLLLAGCATVPTSGPVRSENQAGAQRNQPALGLAPLPPAPGATRGAIVQGFLDAQANPSTLDIARQYLTQDAASRWRPDQVIKVYDGARKPLRGAEGNDSGDLVLEAPELAEIDARGSWSPARPNTRLKFTFRFSQVDGQWRITNPFDGVFIDNDLLLSNYSPQNLYFFNPARDMLVPDPVWLPRKQNAGQQATLLIQALLAGPTQRLGAGVQTLAPPGTEVAVAVPIDAGSVASVSLNDAAIKLPAAEREQLAAQITWTLSSVSTGGVRLTAGGSPLLEGGAEEATVRDFERYDPSASRSRANQLFVLNKHRIEQVNGLDTSQVTLSRVGGELGEYSGKQLALDYTARRAAVLTTNGKLVVATDTGDPNRPAAELDIQGTALRPSFDAQGNLWVVDQQEQSTARIRVFDAEHRPTAVEAPTLVDARITALRMAPDGVRVLVTQRGANGNDRVSVGRAARTGGAIVLDELRSLEIRFADKPTRRTQVADVGWSDPHKVAVLGSDTDGPNQLVEINVDGSNPVLVPGIGDVEGTALAVSPHNAMLPVLLAKDGDLVVRDINLQWTGKLFDVHPPLNPVYPG